MNRLPLPSLLLLFVSLFAMRAGAQPHTPQVQGSPAQSEYRASRVASTSQELFDTIPVSTHSEEARKYVELAVDKYENGLLDDAVVHAQHATEKDPQFALAYALLSFAARRGTPDAAALARAKSLFSHATPDEQLLVRWMTSVQDGNLLPAIMTMNDLLKRFPKDKHVLYLASEWLYFQQDYERARQLMETTLRVDPNFAPTLNRLGYVYIETGNPDPARAIAALKRYVELQPGQPSAEESLAEVLRYAGDDRGSLEHYAGALQLDPTYFTARVGLADTLTFMGDYSNARAQYDRAASIAESSREQFHAECQKALVFFWEGQPGAGRKQLNALADKARAAKDPYAQWEMGFTLALLTANGTEEFAQLKSLEAFLQNPVAGMSEDDRNVSLAAVWRERARTSVLTGQLGVADQAVRQIEELAAKSRNLIIQNIYESAHGYALFAKTDFANAVDGLSTDTHNPLVLLQLILTQEKLGNSAAAESSRTRLKYLRAPTVEWFLVSHSPSATHLGEVLKSSTQAGSDY
jgi:tetratricopeptide (TPR) repeat protein